MKQILIELDEEMAARLKQVAPGHNRRQSEFILGAVRRALSELEEQATADAYRAQPDSATDAYIDRSVWEPGTPRRGRSARLP